MALMWWTFADSTIGRPISVGGQNNLHSPLPSCKSEEAVSFSLSISVNERIVTGFKHC